MLRQDSPQGLLLGKHRLWEEQTGFTKGSLRQTATHTSRNCFSSPLITDSLRTAFISPEGESLVSNLTGEKKHKTKWNLMQWGWTNRGLNYQELHILSFNLCTVPWGSREDHWLVIMENNILSAKLDFFISLQVTLSPFCSKKKSMKRY